MVYRRIRHDTLVRANALTEIERQKDLLRVTLLSIGDAVIITDLESRIVLMNNEQGRGRVNRLAS